jgi:hypothetical protein
MRLSAASDTDKGPDARPPLLSVDGLVQQTPPLFFLFTSLEIPPDINDLREPFLQRWLLVVFLKSEVRNARNLVPLSLYSAVSGTETIKRTYTRALTSFSSVDEARQ